MIIFKFCLKRVKIFIFSSLKSKTGCLGCQAGTRQDSGSEREKTPLEVGTGEHARAGAVTEAEAKVGVGQVARYRPGKTLDQRRR